MAEQNIRVRIQAISELPMIADQIEEIIRLQRQQIDLSQQAMLAARTNSIQQTNAIQGVTDAIGKQTEELRKSSNAHTQATKQVGKEYEVLSKQVQGFTSMVAAAFSVYEIKNFMTGVIDAKTKIDNLKIALDVMLGSKRESTQLFGEIVDLAKKTPFTLDEVADQVVKLKAYNIATKDLIPTVEALGNMAAAVGKEKLPQITLAYGQVQNFGKLMGQEIRQFTEAGIPLFDLLAQSMGKTKEEVIKLSAEHKIMASDVSKAIKQASDVGGRYYNLMQLQSQTLGGQISNLSDRFFMAKARIGDFTEEGMVRAIKVGGDFIEAVAGSDAALRRAASTIASITTLFITWRTVTMAQKVATEVMTAATTAGNFIMGTYNALTIAATGSTNGLDMAQKRLAVSARATWASLAANPLGVLITVIGVATSAYMAFKAANEDVSVAMGQQEYDLRKEQSELNRLADAALKAKEGTDRRRQAVEMLITKYPDYFAGLDAEKVNNNQLNAILKQVNLSYQTRIALAKEAYNNDRLNENQRKNWDAQSEAIDRLVARMPELKRFGNDAVAILNYVNSNASRTERAREGNSLGTFFDSIVGGDPVKALEKALEGEKKIQEAQKQSLERSKQLRYQADTEELNQVVQKYDRLIAAAKGNAAEIKRLEKEKNDALLKLQGTFQSQTVQNTQGNNDKMKEITLLSAKEINVLLKQQNADSYQEKLAAINAEEELEIKQANKAKVRAKASAAEIALLTEQARKKIEEIHAKFDAQRELEDYKHFQETSKLIDAVGELEAHGLSKRVITTKEAAKDIKELENSIAKSREDTAKINEQVTKNEFEFRQASIRAIMQTMRQMEGLAGDLGSTLLMAFTNFDLITGKSLKAAKERLAVEEQVLKMMQSQSDGSLKAQAGIEAQINKIANLKKTIKEFTELTTDAQAGLIMQVIGLAEQFKDFIVSGIIENNRKIIEANEKVRETIVSTYESILKANQNLLDTELENFTGSYEERMAIIDDFYERQMHVMESRDLVNAQITYSNEILKINTDTTQKLSNIWDFKKGGFGATFSLSLIKTVMAWKEAKGEKEAASLRFEAFQKQIEINQAELAIQKAKDIRDYKIEKLKEELEAFRETKNAEIDAEKDALDQRKALNEQFYSDKSLRLQEDDTYRRELLALGEAREIAALEAAKQRELDRATSAEERTRIINAFEALIAEVHAKYQDAVGDKTKEISLANTEVKAQEKDKSVQLETESTNIIKALKQQIADKDAQITSQMTAANNDYKNAVNAANRQIFELTKQMKIAELRAEIAILRGKRNFLNKGKIDSAIDDLNAAIGEIAGLTFDGGGSSAPVSGGSSGGGSTPGTPTTGTTPGTNLPGDGSGTSPDQPEFLFKGTEYVRGLGFPDGIDTVPAMLTKGERVLPVDLNKEIGTLSNEMLVERVKAYDRLAAQYPQLLDPGRWSEIAGARLRLPSGIVSSQGNSTVDLGSLENEMRSVRKAIENKNLVSITLDRNGLAVAQLGVHAKVNYYNNLFQR